MAQNMHFKLEKPNISGIKPEEIFKFLEDEKVRDIVSKSMYPEYLYWDNVKYKELPSGYKPEVAWAAIKFIRNNVLHRRESVIVDENGKKFFWVSSLLWYDEFLHEVDMNLGGALLGLARDLDENAKRRFITRGVMEEAIASSQLEGANTTRRVAKQMLREGRKPRNKSEQMIVNNYQAMLFIEDTLKSEKLTIDRVKDIQAILTKGTLESATDEGQFRTDKDNIVVQDGGDGTIYHVAPNEKFTRHELERLVAYANDELKDSGFVHPVFKATLIHFWIGYLHPFADGNGRLARALFYWYLLKHEYWGFAYLPLSKVIKNSPVQYGMAYVYTEQDDNDLTYFFDYNARKIKQSIKEFREYESQTMKENTKMVKEARTKYHLNDRQIQLLRFYQKNKDEGVSVAAHMNINEISRATAITDLKTLEGKGFLSKKKVGRKVYFYATDNVEKLFS